MMDGGAAEFGAAVVSGSKLNVECRDKRPPRAPIRLAHGRYSCIKMQATFDLYVECCKSMEARAKFSPYNALPKSLVLQSSTRATTTDMSHSGTRLDDQWRDRF